MTRFYGYGLAGAVMAGAAIALLAWSAHQLAFVGTCATSGYDDMGNPVRTCTSREVWMAIGILPMIGLLLAGLAVANRRAPPHRRTNTFTTGVWAVLFLAFAGAFISTAFDPAGRPAGFDRWALAIPGCVFAVLAVRTVRQHYVARRDAERTARLIREGEHGTGVVVAVQHTRVSIGDNPRVSLDVEVHPRPGEPFTVYKTMTVPRAAIPRPGDEVEVWWDRDDPQTCAVGLPATHAPIDVGAPAGTSKQLELLARLHRSGTLDDAEFEAARSRLLAGS